MALEVFEVHFLVATLEKYDAFEVKYLTVVFFVHERVLGPWKKLLKFDTK